jgi:hypothetical protein
MAKPKGRCLTPKLSFAWIECDAPADGVAFSQKFIRDLGFKNLMSELPRGKRLHRKDMAHPGLQIRWHRNKALLVFPGENKDLNLFLARWVCSPGIKKTSKMYAELTFKSDATKMADMICVSGHGNAGTLMGNNGSLDITLTIHKYGCESHSDQLKYILIASCNNVSERMGVDWLPLFRRPNPIRGILGYHSTYKGDKFGVNVLRQFGRLLKNKPPISILDAWKRANDNQGSKDWGAQIHEKARHDTLKDWKCGTLTPLDPKGKVLHFTHDSYRRGGKEVIKTPAQYMAGFSIADKPDGNVIMFMPVSEEETGRNNTDIGLFLGEDGCIDVKTTSGFLPEKIRAVLYYYRQEKDKMDINKLLVFAPQYRSRMKFMRLNPNTKAGHMDGFEITLKEDERRGASFFYTVCKDALTYYNEVISTGDKIKTYGRFFIKLVEPKVEKDFGGIWLRETRK